MIPTLILAVLLIAGLLLVDLLYFHFLFGRSKFLTKEEDRNMSRARKVLIYLIVFAAYLVFRATNLWEGNPLIPLIAVLGIVVLVENLIPKKAD